MLVFSLIAIQSDITLFFKPPNSNPIIHLHSSLLHLPDNLHLPLSSCILVYTWFYNQFFLPYINYTTPSVTSSIPSKVQRQKTHPYSTLFLLYILLNISLAYTIHYDLLPIQSLGILPMVFMASLFPFRSPANKDISSSTVFPSAISNSSSNAEKLSYLSAWQSTNDTKLRLMNFTPGGGSVYIVSCASTCISNRKEDFIHLTPLTNTVFKGISSYLQIEGSGTLCWHIRVDNGDEVSLHIQNSLYVPTAPMCLLSPQSVSQQTNNTLYGYTVHAQHSTLTFSGYIKTFFYNSANNLPMFFTSTNLSPSSFFSIDFSSNTSALLASEEPSSNL